MVSHAGSYDVPLPWARKDIEQRLFFRGGRYTRVNSLLSFIMALLLACVFYASLFPVRESSFAEMFLPRSSVSGQAQNPVAAFIPFAIVFFSSWCLAILFLKSRKLRFQRRALNFEVVPQDVDFVLSAGNVDTVIDRIYEIVDEPRHFILFNRISVALANLRNLGRVGDVDEILKSQAENDESALETSYSLLSGFIWAIPVLGFIGTVLGLSSAIGGFGGVLEASNDIETIKGGLKSVTGGLSDAFVTTLQALVAALFIQIILTFLKKSEQEFLDECGEYCTTQIVNRLRIMPFERME